MRTLFNLAHPRTHFCVDAVAPQRRRMRLAAADLRPGARTAHCRIEFESRFDHCRVADAPPSRQA